MKYFMIDYSSPFLRDREKAQKKIEKSKKKIKKCLTGRDGCDNI